MTQKRSTKRAFWMSALSLLLCVSMLVGTTYAWFTDSVVSGMNTIMAGNLDVALLAGGKEVDAETKLFDDVTLWEPGAVVYENLQVVNKGSLALQYQMALNFQDENELEGHKLSEVLKVAIIDKIETKDRATVLAAAKAAKAISLYDFFVAGSLEANAEAKEQGVVIFWEPGENDNLYNANNGKTTSNGNPLGITFGVKLVATQEMSESDSFGYDYDALAVFPNFSGKFYAEADVTGKVDANNALTEDVTVGKVGGRMYATVPQGTVLKPDVTELTLVVDLTERSENIEMVSGQVSRSLDVHVEGIADTNTVPVIVDLGIVMPKGLKSANIQLYHVENGTPALMTATDTLTAHNQFAYNPDNGDVSVSMATFSEVTAVVAAGNGWTGDRETDWYTNPINGEYIIDSEEDFAGFAAIVGGMATGIGQDDFKGKTVKLGKDLDLGGKMGKVWYPIGYKNSTGSYVKTSGISVTSNVHSFEGTFDGQGHTIANIHQNTWEMFGDYNDGYKGTPNHYKDGMGLFGFVYNGTVKNLTVKGFESDGEFATTGVVAAYVAGNSTFDNIKILNSNPRAYNVPNGGVVGYAYDANGASVINFNNVTVDPSNKITALWGSWDVGCGGILGRVNGATTVNMTNCTVGAHIDVFNDVCGNYQYYQYRYAGMLIGTVGPDGDPKSGPEQVNFENVKAYIGNWADYYYCEFEKNSQGSYTDDYQFSRVEEGDINFDPNTNLPYKENLQPCRHQHQGTEDKMGLYLPFDQIYTGYGWGASPVKAADGVEVIKYFYTVKYMDATGSEVLATEYVTAGERSDSRLWANEHAVKTNSITPIPTGKKFQGWVNTASEKTTSIQAGNYKDVVLYESWTNPFTARFVDINGNVIYSETFHSGDRNISAPPVPKIEGYTGEWEKYTLGESDITIHPIYLPDSSGGSGESGGTQDVVIGNSDLTAKLLFQYLEEGKNVVMNNDIVGDGKNELGLNGGSNNFCEISGSSKKSVLNLNTYELTCKFNHNAKKSWHIFDINNGGSLRIGGGINREGTLVMNLSDMKADCYLFVLDSTSTLVLEAGLTIAVNYPVSTSSEAPQMFAFAVKDGNTLKTFDFSNYSGIYVDKTTPGVLRVNVGVTTTITANNAN